MKLRSIELELPDIASATTFMRDVWGLHDSAPALTNIGGSNTSYLRGTGGLPYIWSMREAASPAMRSVSFSGTAAELEALSARLVAKGMAAPRREDYADEPGGGHGFSIRGFEGQPYRFITGDARVPAMPTQDDKPIELSHVVFNTQDRAGAMAWVRDELGFTLSDEASG
jgi:2,3-dihydroxy-p-cumate/2,3-dihydroxybenzoate 3,4-dioxygenase